MKTCPEVLANGSLCGKRSDVRSKKGRCTLHMQTASAAWRAMVARQCEARDARHVEYDTKVGELELLCRQFGIREMTISPANTGFAHYLKKHGGAGKIGVLRVQGVEEQEFFDEIVDARIVR